MADPNTNRDAVRAWLEKGDDDLRSARILLGADPPLTDVVCFHSQQAAEKYLKGFLVYNGVEPPFTHNLTTLLILCKQHDSALVAYLRPAEILNPFAVRFRYPGMEEPTDLTTARSALNAAEDICNAVRSRIPELK